MACCPLQAWNSHLRFGTEAQQTAAARCALRFAAQPLALDVMVQQRTARWTGSILVELVPDGAAGGRPRLSEGQAVLLTSALGGYVRGETVSNGSGPRKLHALVQPEPAGQCSTRGAG